MLDINVLPDSKHSFSYFKECITDFTVDYLAYLSMYLPLREACRVPEGKETAFPSLCSSATGQAFALNRCSINE